MLVRHRFWSILGQVAEGVGLLVFWFALILGSFVIGGLCAGLAYRVFRLVAEAGL